MASAQTKSFKIQYLKASETLKSDLDTRLQGDLKESLAKRDHSFYVTRVAQYKNVFCLNKQRTTNIPKIGNLTDRTDKKLELGHNEGLVEKAYFAFDKSSGKLVFQCNGNVCNTSAFPNIISALFRQGEVLALVSLDRELMDNDLIASVNIAVAFPDGPEAISGGEIEDLEFIEGIKRIGASANIAPSQWLTLSISAGHVKSREEFIKPGIIKKIMESPYLGVKKAEVVVKNEKLNKDDEGIDPGFLLLNLMGTSKTHHIDVEMDDRYPSESDIAAKLQRCLTD